MGEKKKPNIIIFNPDEMRWDTMGHMGNPAAYTPNMDRFVQNDAVSFENAYCQNTVCVPSRCSFLTGLYPHVHGHRTMQHLLHEGETSLFQELKEAGYYVWMNSRNDLIAGQIPGLAERHADEIYYYDKNKAANTVGSGKGAYRAADNAYPYSHFAGVMPIEMGSDSNDVRAAIERIEHPVDDRPLCLFVGLVNPHPPYAVEQKYYDKIKKDLLPARIRADETAGKSRMIEEIRKYSGMQDFPEEQWREMQTIYLAQCAMIDDLFGQMCDALKRTGEYDNSAIFVLSDHGDFAGNYDLPEKAQNTFEDCLTRVPLLIKPPKGEAVDPGVAEGIVELVDFYATVMDYAGVEPDHDQFGISLRPVVENREVSVRKYAFCEGGRRASEEQCDEYHSSGPNGPSKDGEYWARMKAQLSADAHEKGTMITDGSYKYVERLSGRNELYDLKNDPQERTNLYEKEKDSAVVMELKEAMLHWYQETCDVVPRKYDSRFTEERIWTMFRGMCPPEMEEDVRKRIREDYDIMNCVAYMMQLVSQKQKTEDYSL